MDNKISIEDVVRKQHVFFKSSSTFSYKFRISELKKLKKAIKKFESEFISAFKTDLGKSEFESVFSEIGFILYDLTGTIKNLKKWMKPKRVRTPLTLQPASSKTYFSPLGVNLIISPFNYPFNLTFSPLIAAIAAGNTAVIKTSNLTPNVSAVIQKLIAETFEPDYVAYISGGIPESTLLLEQKFNHIFFTGSHRVGSIVLNAAAKYLTPVTLELGGKSPCVVHADADIEIAVKRIVYGKFMNAGQTCIAPDYVMVHESIKEKFLDMLKQRIIELYGNDASRSDDYGRIVSEDHTSRLIELIDRDKVVVGGYFDKQSKFIAPTVMKDVSFDDAIMQDEIFGPILPVLEYKELESVFDNINDLTQHPLAGYIFSQSKSIQEKFISEVQFGGGCVNHCLQHFGNQYMPFGGVGDSGIGGYHGFSGFECFSHKKSMLKSVTWFDLFSILYPPYKKYKLNIIRKLLK